MEYKSISDFIGEHIRFGQHHRKKVIGISDAHWQKLEQDTFIGNCSYAKGSEYKVFETNNFGWITFKLGTLTPDGKVPGKLIYKW